MNLTAVREYECVKGTTHHPDLMARAHSVRIESRPAAWELLIVLSRACNRPLCNVQWGKRNWARPNKEVLNLRLVDLTVGTVLHELAHLYAPQERNGRRRVFHGVEFVATLDLLLVVWDTQN